MSLHEIKPDFRLVRPKNAGTLEHVTVADSSGRPYELATYSVDNSSGKTDKTLITFMPWADAVSRPFSQDRLAVVSEAIDARVLAVDNPGIGEETDSLGVRAFSSSGLDVMQDRSRMQWEAIYSHREYLEKSRIMLGYYSLGAAMATSFASVMPEGRQVEKIIMWDIVSQKTKLARLAFNFFDQGDRNFDYYMGENPHWVRRPVSPVDFAKSILRQPRGHLSYPFLLSRGKSIDYIQMAQERGVLVNDTEIHLFDNEKSNVSATSQNDAFADNLRTVGFTHIDRRTFRGETHGVADSLPRLVVPMRTLSEG